MNDRAWTLSHETRALGNGHTGNWSDAAARRIQGRYLRPHAVEADELLAGIESHARTLDEVEQAARETRAFYEEARVAGDEVVSEIEGAEYAVSMTHDSARRAHEFETRAGALERDVIAAAHAADQACAGVPGEHGQTTLGVHHVQIGDREAALSAARGLGARERALIAAYTGENGDAANYRTVNPLLRVGTIAELERSAATITGLQHALAGAPQYSGLVYRGTTLSGEQISRYRPGERVVEQAFMSTSADPAKEFGGNTRFVIHSQTGRDVSRWSTHSGEREVLYGHSQPFQVISNTFDAGSGRHVIVLKEVSR
jgi:hypothetical protein